jgi:hypothetical protein
MVEAEALTKTLVADFLERKVVAVEAQVPLAGVALIAMEMGNPVAQALPTQLLAHQ